MTGLRQTWALHGWKDRSQGEKNVDRLDPYVDNPVDNDYGLRVGVISTSHKNENEARQVALSVKIGDDAIGHSNGCLIIAKSLIHHAPFRRIVLINPAMDVGWAFPRKQVVPHLEAILVLYSPHDIAVRLGSRWPWNDWGAAGAKGLSFPDDRVQLVDWSILAKSNGLTRKKYLRHSGIFKRPELYGPRIGRWLRDLTPFMEDMDS